MNRYCLPLIALTLSCALAEAQAGELGRLFYTPQQRQQLDLHETSVNAVDGGGRNFIMVNGVVQKQGGKRIVWLNGAAQAAGEGNDKTPANVAVTVPGKTYPVPAKVGQRVMIEAPPAPEENK